MKSTKSQLELSPLRSLDDFLLGSARFQLPNFKNPEKWENRITYNLLYYQTNYFVLIILVKLAFICMYPADMILGLLSLVLIYGVYLYCFSSNSSVVAFQKQHPHVGMLAVVVAAGLLTNLIASLLVFLFGVLFPIFITFVHASLRMRNVRNKVSSIERLISTTTPMGYLLQSFVNTQPHIEVHIELVVLRIKRSILRWCGQLQRLSPRSLFGGVLWECLGRRRPRGRSRLGWLGQVSAVAGPASPKQQKMVAVGGPFCPPQPRDTEAEAGPTRRR